jgi:hypothetical protein
MGASNNRVRPALESLEGREVMDATIGVSGGALVITGTSQADAVRVTEAVVGGVRGYQVDALVHQGRQRTFNGGETSAFFAGARRVSADLGRGDDLLVLQDLSTRTTSVPVVLGPRVSFLPRAGDVTVSAGAGSDVIQLQDVRVAGRLLIDLGSGNDLASAGASSARSAEVRGGAGRDDYFDAGGNDFGVVGGPNLDSVIATHRESVDGQITLTVPPTAADPLGRQEFAGAGFGTHLGRYTESGGHQFTAPNEDGVGLVLNGRFTSVAADGATLSGTYFGTYTAQADGRVRFEVTAVYQGGTGRLSGVTGRADAVAVVQADGALHFDTLGSLTF